MGIAVRGGLRHPHVDLAISSPQGDPQRPLRLVEDEVDIAGKEVPRSQRNDSHRGRCSCQRRGDRADGPVPASGDDDVDPLVEGADRDPLAGVLRGGLKHERRVPPLETADRLGGGGQIAHIGLRGIDDEGGTVPGRVIDHLVGEVRRVGVASHRVERASHAVAAADEERGYEHDEGTDDDDPGHQGIQLDDHVPNLQCPSRVQAEGRMSKTRPAR